MQSSFFVKSASPSLQLVLRARNVKLPSHEGLTEEEVWKAGLPTGGAGYGQNKLWHMDLSDSECPPEVSAMYMVHSAGKDDTLFARCPKWSL